MKRHSVSRLTAVVFGAALCAIATGCNLFDPEEEPVCVLGPQNPHVALEVRDSVTGAAAAAGSSGRVTAQGYDRPLVVVDSLRMVENPGASQRGTVAVVVAKPGYVEWITNVVVQTTQRCDAVVTRTLQARLRRVSS